MAEDWDIQIDPEESESRAFFDYMGDIYGKRVLEVGCGDGRLTRIFASAAGSVRAIDPDPEAIESAVEDLPKELRDKVRFEASSIEELEAGEKYELAILSWSL